MKKNKVEKLEVSESKAEVFFAKIVSDRKLIVSVLTIVLTVGFLVAFMQIKNQKSHQKVQSTVSLSKHIKDLNLSGKQLKTLKKIASNYSSIQPEIDAHLARLYLNQGQLKQVKSILKRINSRTDLYMPQIKSFNLITCEIEASEYSKALQKSYELKHSLQKEDNLKTLYTLNLLRITNLEKKLGHALPYKEALGELLTYEFDFHQKALDQFKINNLDFQNYLLEQSDL